MRAQKCGKQSVWSVGMKVCEGNNNNSDYSFDLFGLSIPVVLF